MCVSVCVCAQRQMGSRAKVSAALSSVPSVIDSILIMHACTDNHVVHHKHSPSRHHMPYTVCPHITEVLNFCKTVIDHGHVF